MVASKKTKKILLVGLTFWIHLIAERLKEFTFTTIDYYDWWNMSMKERIKLIDQHRIVHYMWGHYNIKEFFYIRLKKKKVYTHYMGSDVLRAKKFKKNPWWCAKLANNTFCDSPNLQTELADMGIKAIVLPNPVPHLVFGLPPFPRQNRVLAYINQINENFYHINDVEYIAKASPEWIFHIVGHDGRGRKPMKNLQYFGHVDRHVITHLIKDSKVYLRLTDHDATGKMALEAMAQGRYVIRNMQWPHTIYTLNNEEVIAALKKLAVEKRLNITAHEYIKREWCDEITFGRFVKLYRETNSLNFL
ncbi:MAG: glycosyltransferase [Deltaproteobacteria bacterium]|uniref:hypothetical protein n=1 Tax=Desulfobacula sp. TaxID=2593537 RepID=UPI0019933119|nr:glycosyltransferase [Candidatus Desulfobacula maris]MBL6994873.1 glycosyltransferase [Desulfobacula sp.]